MKIVALVGLLLGVVRLLGSIPTRCYISPRIRCANSLHQIGYALLQYHDDYGCFPPAVVADAQGRPMHSWRTLILPYLEASELYQAYNFSLPWDAPENAPVVATRLRIFECPEGSSAGGPAVTHFRAVTGPGTTFPRVGTTRLADLRDGLTTTLVLMEAREAVPWAAPIDLDPEQVVGLLTDPDVGRPGRLHGGVRNLQFPDGSTLGLRSPLSPGLARAILTIRGGEVITPDDLNP